MILCLLAPLAAGADRPLRQPVLVELFTSEGCSSCPPADALLAQLAKQADVIVLSEHVDYWNELGWKDPYSQVLFTARQREYSQALHRDDIYTPQMIVNGRAEFVGGDRRRAQQEIDKAEATPGAAVAIDAQGSNRFRVTVRKEASPSNARADVMLAITEDNLSTDVRHGENSGRKLNHTAVVRSLAKIGSLDLRKAVEWSGETTVKPEAAWHPENLRVVVFVQEQSGRRVIGAGAIPLLH